MTFLEACSSLERRGTSHLGAAAHAILEGARNGLTDQEVAHLARSIAASGATLPLPKHLAPFADVASTGAPASLTTLLCPLLIASMNIRVPKLSATGSVAGAIDSMALIPGFRSKLSAFEFITALARVSFAHAEPSGDLCPADAVVIAARRESNMMENRFLAVASLLAKKLALPGTHVCFDCRVGKTGNIGAEPDAADAAAKLFIRVGRRLNISVAAVLTDNRSFPCSALGRLESLRLLATILDPRSARSSSSETDAAHVRTCVTLAALACNLAEARESTKELESKMFARLESGEVMQCLVRHLEAQGTNWENLMSVVSFAQKQGTVHITADRDGFWIPPKLDSAAAWIKNAQRNCDKALSHMEPFRRQVGMRLLRSPGSKVGAGDALMEILIPEGTGAALPTSLAAEISDRPPNIPDPILGVFR